MEGIGWIDKDKEEQKEKQQSEKKSDLVQTAAGGGMRAAKSAEAKAPAFTPYDYSAPPASRPTRVEKPADCYNPYEAENTSLGRANKANLRGREKARGFTYVGGKGGKNGKGGKGGMRGRGGGVKGGRGGTGKR